MASYFIGSSNTGSGFGGSGNLFAQLGEIGPVWQNTMLQGMNTQNAVNEFQYKQMLDPLRVAAAGNAYQAQELQNLYAARDANELLQAMANAKALGAVAPAQQMQQNYGYNYGQVDYTDNLVQQAPMQARPTQPAATGNYAATAPGNQQWFTSAFDNTSQSLLSPRPPELTYRRATHSYLDGVNNGIY